MPSSRHVRITRTAISPRFATNTFVIGLGTVSYPKWVPGPDAEPRHLNGVTRFSQVEWFAEIDSTNRHLADAARSGAPDGLVAVADLQHAGRGRLGRVWSAPAGASLLVSVLARPRLPREAW